MDCSLPGSSGYGIFQARVLEWVAISFSKKRLEEEQLLRRAKHCQLLGTELLPTPNLHVEVLTPNVKILGDKAFKEIS